jgi:hypothetical protein
VIDIKTELNPMRLLLARRDPIELMVELVNNSNKDQMITLTIITGDQIAFDKGGRSNFQIKKINSFKAGERIRDYYNIYPKPMAERGAQIIQVRVDEHFNNSFQYIQSKKVKELTLRID